MLLVDFLGKENVYGVLMPNGIQKDIKDSYLVVEKLGIKNFEINLEKTELALLDELNRNVNISRESKINITPRLRMTTLYALAQTLNARVCGTGNLSERSIGYFTKWGDGACDFNLIGNLTQKEVVDLGLYLCEKFAVKEELILKTPTDGLSDLTDEEKLNLKYKDIDNYLKDNLKDIKKDVLEKIKEKINYSEHKRNSIPMPNFEGVRR